MTRVIDANVIVYALLDEGKRASAFKALAEERCIAPQFLCLEVGHVLSKYVRSQIISENMAIDIFNQIPKIVDLKPSLHLASNAFELALRFRHSIYDCLYLAVAIEAKCSLLTADRRLAQVAFDLNIEVISFK